MADLNEGGLSSLGWQHVIDHNSNWQLWLNPNSIPIYVSMLNGRVVDMKLSIFLDKAFLDK